MDAASHPSLAEHELVTRLRGGDEEAFAELVERYTPSLLRVAREQNVTQIVVGTSRGSSLGSWLWVALAVVWGLTVPHMLAVSRFDRLRRRAREHELSASDR